MSIPQAKLSQNFISNHKYYRVFNNRKIYLFILGLTLSVGDIKLILATSIFTLTMLMTYQFKTISWKNYLKFFRQVLTSENKQIILSISTAGVLAISSYLILNIWTEIDNKWLALGIIWQIIFSTTGIGFLLWKFSNKSSISQKKRDLSNTFSDIIIALNANSPLERLSAINQLFRLWELNQLTEKEVDEVIEYFTLLKDIENQPIIVDKLGYCLEKMSLSEVTPLHFPRRINQNIKHKISIAQ